jgi:hypothetical protein
LESVLGFVDANQHGLRTLQEDFDNGAIQPDFSSVNTSTGDGFTAELSNGSSNSVASLVANLSSRFPRLEEFTQCLIRIGVALTIREVLWDKRYCYDIDADISYGVLSVHIHSYSMMHWRRLYAHTQVLPLVC